MRERSLMKRASRMGWVRAGEKEACFTNLLADEVGVESVQRLDRKRFNLVINNRAAGLP
jgi:hypothetical protein